MNRAGNIRYGAPDAAGIARLALAHEGRQNAITVAMWRALRDAFEALQAQVDAGDDAVPRAVIVHGIGGHFAAGADIAEFPAFRFEERSLRRYHEEVVAYAARANKRLLRQAEHGAIDADMRRTAFDYAGHPEHAARVHAFLHPKR